MNILRFLLSSVILLSAGILSAQETELIALKNREAWAAADTLNACRLHVYFKDDTLNTSTNSMTSRGLLKKNRLQAYRIEAYYKTPNSYQKVDSMKWVVHFVQGGFLESQYMLDSNFSATFQSFRPRLKPYEGYLLVEIENITTSSGYNIMHPILENEKYVSSSFSDTKLYYKFFDTYPEIKKYVQINKNQNFFPKAPVLVFKLE